MKKVAIVVAILFFFTFFASQSFAVPIEINYQGILKDSGGTPVSGSVVMEFSLYDADGNPTVGSLVWGETHALVTVVNGIYNVLIGSGSPLPATPFPLDPAVFNNPDLWLQVSVDGEAMAPRQKLASVPFALKAEEAAVAAVAQTAQAVVDGAVTGSSIAPDSITSTELDPSIVTLDQIAAVCPDGQGLFKTASGWECKETISLLPGDNFSVTCYDGPAVSRNVGICIDGTRLWASSGPGLCSGQVLPGTLNCDGQDNDCNNHDDCYDLIPDTGWTFPEFLSESISPINYFEFNLLNAIDPQVAMDNNGNAIVVWGQRAGEGEPYQIFKSEYRKGTWTHPAPPTDAAYMTDYISPDGQPAIDPQVAMDDNGNVIIIWLQYDGTSNQIFMSEYRNSTWSHPTSLTDNISPDGTFAYLPQVAMDNSGNAIIVWRQEDGTTSQIFKSEYRTSTWSHPTSLTDNISPDGTSAVEPQVAMDNNGNAIINWHQFDGTSNQIFMSEYRSSTWSHPTSLTDNISPDIQEAVDPQVAMDNSGNAIIVWNQSDGTTGQIFKSEYRSSTWSHPFLLADNISPDGQPAIDPQVAMDDSGNAIIVWNQEDGTTSQIFKSEYRSSTWSHPTSLTDNISPDGTSAVEPQVAMDNNGNAIIVWAQGDGTNNNQIFWSEYRNDTWRHPVLLTDNISPYGQPATIPRVAIDDYANAIIVWLQEDGTDAGNQGSDLQIFKAEYRTDNDGDTFSPPYDCNDTDPAFNPGAVETGGDGLDNNCDGLDYPDTDGDGAGTDTDCNDSDPNNWLSCGSCVDGDTDLFFAGCDAYSTINGPDCNDADPLILPGVFDDCGDGKDNNCSGVVDEECPCNYNSDPDGVCGFAQISDITGLCDAPVEYEATETSCDGMDNDCDGQVDEEVCLVLNEVLTDGATAGDPNGDGTIDGLEDEFVEIINISLNVYDLSGFKIVEEYAPAPRHTFAAGTLLSPGEVIVVFGGGTPPTNHTGAQYLAASNADVIPFGLALNDTGDILRLVDPSDVVIAEFAYGDRGSELAVVDESSVRDPDGLGVFINHTSATGALGSLFSPGHKIDGSNFP